MTEDRLNAENELIIQEMLRNTKGVELPSELTINPILHKGDEVLPAPMTVKEISSAGYVWVWDSRSFEKIPIIYYMLPSKLRQRRPDGSFRFTTIDPGQLPNRGAIKCMLHEKGEDRKHFDELGFRVCPKEGINNQYQLQQHMIKKHPQEWKAIKLEQEAKEKEEDRNLQRLLLTNQLSKLEKKNDADEETIVKEKAAKWGEFTCKLCDKSFTYERPYKRHIKTCKGLDDLND